MALRPMEKSSEEDGIVLSTAVVMLVGFFLSIILIIAVGQLR